MWAWKWKFTFPEGLFHERLWLPNIKRRSHVIQRLCTWTPPSLPVLVVSWTCVLWAKSFGGSHPFLFKKIKRCCHIKKTVTCAIKTVIFIDFISGLLTFVYCKIQGQKHTVLSIQFLHPSVSPHAFTPVWLLSFSSSLLLRAPICFIIFINDVPFPLCHIRGSHLWFWWYCRSLGQLKVWDPIWSVSHKKTFKPQRLLRLQQTFNSCLNQVPVLWNMGLRETESLWAVSLHTDGSLSAQEKVVILFGKALKGKINEYSEWT